MPKLVKKYKAKIKNKGKTNKNNLWKSRRKKGRLIVRNLPFKITEEQLRSHFEKYGNLQDIKLLKRADGKLVGCGFVEFKTKDEATKAIAETSGKPLLNRPIIVDWAVPKDSFSNKEIKKEVKDEPTSSDEEKPSVESLNSSHIKIEQPENECTSDDYSVKSELESSDDNEVVEKDEYSSDSLSENSDLDSQDLSGNQRKRVFSNDVQEGCTVFLKNVPFSATNEDVKECMLKFGPIFYALVCVDPITEHSKGTAFVKFQNKESAEQCLTATADQLRVSNSILQAHEALNKKDIQQRVSQKNEEKKIRDGRNLYLVKEGVVQAGTPAARGVSTSDMDKRLQLERWKTQMLRNLSMVVSRTRLVIHNLPPTLSDDGLRNVLKKFSPPSARLTEARVMRDLRSVDSQGRGKSKEFAFVSFTRHEDCLAILRAINNNPEVFSAQKRPIVGFSIENKSILNAKQRRLDMSKKKNPYYNQELNRMKNDDTSKTLSYSQPENTNDTTQFSGLEAHPGQKVKLLSVQTLKSQSLLHKATVHKDRKQKNTKLNLKKNKTRKTKKQNSSFKELKDRSFKKNAKMDEDSNLTKLILKYKQQPPEKKIKKKKWFE